MKCAICSQDIEETFLGKLNGTVLRMKNGDKVKEYWVCGRCQKEYGDGIKKKMLELQ